MQSSQCKKKCKEANKEIEIARAFIMKVLCQSFMIFLCGSCVVIRFSYPKKEKSCLWLDFNWMFDAHFSEDAIVHLFTMYITSFIVAKKMIQMIYELSFDV